MPFAPISVPPGVVKSESDYAASSRWIDMDHVRFVGQFPEKIGGTQELFSDTFAGIARAAEAWASFAGVQQLAWGTACALFHYASATLSNITPFRTDATSIALNNPFDTVNMSAVVTVHDTAHGITAAGVVVNFDGFSAVGGITIDGDYTVTTLVDVDTFTITHSAPATSTVSGGGGAGTASYTLNCGNVSSTYVLGWGVGTWGREPGWGTDASLAAAAIVEPTNWSLDVLGEDLVVNQTDQTIWLYDTSTGPLTRPAAIANAPARVRSIMVTPERYVFALGCTNLAGNFDPMTVRWPDVEDITDWTPGASDTSNERKLQGGTKLIGGEPIGNGIALVWSDFAAFVFQYTGAANSIYSSRKVGEACGLIGQNAHAVLNGVGFWMSESDLFMYAGFVQPIPNREDIRDWVFENINPAHKMKSFAFKNPDYGEVWFVFPGLDSTEPSLYVAVRTSDFTWIHGTWDRSAAALYTTGETRPILFGSEDGIVYIHDVKGVADNNGAALPFHLELAPTDIQGGNVAVDIWGFVPDFQTQQGSLSLYLYGLDHPRDGIVMSETQTISPTAKIVDFRMAGRQFGLILSGDDAGITFRMGRWALELGESAAQQRNST